MDAQQIIDSLRPAQPAAPDLRIATILPEDFDVATSQPWSSTTCLVATALKRSLEIEKLTGCCGNSATSCPLDMSAHSTLFVWKDRMVADMQGKFDRVYGDDGMRMPPEVRAQANADLEVALEQLPYSFVVEVRPTL